MQIHNYNPLTLEYTGSGFADPDPLNEGAFIAPAFSTDIAPPDHVEGMARVFVDGEWSLVPDHRGETWWHPNGTSETIIDLGDPADKGLLDVEPAPPVVVPQQITRRQLLLALMSYNLITPSEALDAAQTGAAPAAIAAMFDVLSEPDRTAAYITWASMSVAERSNPLVAQLAAAQGMNEAAIDQFFIAASAL